MEEKTLTKTVKFENLSELDKEKIKDQDFPAETDRQPSKLFLIYKSSILFFFKLHEEELLDFKRRQLLFLN